MNKQSLIEHKGNLATRLQALEREKAQLLRKLKAVDVLLEDAHTASLISEAPVVQQLKTKRIKWVPSGTKPRSIARHTVRFSPRISLIGAVETVAKKQGGSFTSTELLKAIQGEYPEFNLGETKHISSPLSDLVKRGILSLERQKDGSLPNLYRVTKGGSEKANHG
jgi:hypothetical protein